MFTNHTEYPCLIIYINFFSSLYILLVAILQVWWDNYTNCKMHNDRFSLNPCRFLKREILVSEICLFCFLVSKLWLSTCGAMFLIWRSGSIVFLTHSGRCDIQLEIYSIGRSDRSWRFSSWCWYADTSRYSWTHDRSIEWRYCMHGTRGIFIFPQNYFWARLTPSLPFQLFLRKTWDNSQKPVGQIVRQIHPCLVRCSTPK